MMELLSSETNVEDYLNESIRSRRFSRVNKAMALKLLEKLREGLAVNSLAIWASAAMSGAGTNGSATGSASHPKAIRKKHLDFVIKSLKEDVKK